MKATDGAGCIVCPGIYFMLKKWDVNMWAGFIQLRIGSNGGLLRRTFRIHEDR
jgi:hypothetical protein